MAVLRGGGQHAAEVFLPVDLPHEQQHRRVVRQTEPGRRAVALCLRRRPRIGAVFHHLNLAGVAVAAQHVAGRAVDRPHGVALLVKPDDLAGQLARQRRGAGDFQKIVVIFGMERPDQRNPAAAGEVQRGVTGGKRAVRVRQLKRNRVQRAAECRVCGGQPKGIGFAGNLDAAVQQRAAGQRLGGDAVRRDVIAFVARTGQFFGIGAHDGTDAVQFRREHIAEFPDDHRAEPPW